jgi:hypothetical protein
MDVHYKQPVALPEFIMYPSYFSSSQVFSARTGTSLGGGIVSVSRKCPAWAAASGVLQALELLPRVSRGLKRRTSKGLRTPDRRSSFGDWRTQALCRSLFLISTLLPVFVFLIFSAGPCLSQLTSSVCVSVLSLF